MQGNHQQEIWQELKKKLPFQTTEQQTALRNKYWQGFDVNGNGYLSLAEVDKGCEDVLNLPKLFHLKPVLMRAFTKAKTALKAKSKYGDDYISKAEFRYLLKYLRMYYQYWVAFERIDKNGDKKISVNQFKQASQIMQKWGIKVDKNNAQHLFNQIDKNHGGSILFEQFCQWAIKVNLDIDDDDDLI